MSQKVTKLVHAMHPCHWQYCHCPLMLEAEAHRAPAQLLLQHGMLEARARMTLAQLLLQRALVAPPRRLQHLMQQRQMQQRQSMCTCPWHLCLKPQLE